ncbi:MAG TPA: hypothetical protein VNA24_16685 [Hyalangium sp.]|nr:hypothetical protein [Hyalangium sp.]
MTETPAKKLSLKKETLRTLDNNQLDQLDGVVGGTTVVIIIIVTAQ